ncbi:MAG TPA: hypothetical protein DCL75_11975, partial [Ktedonobacter sp.]|nr:hypothetical protein [Ktedonobacter sp.]
MKRKQTSADSARRVQALNEFDETDTSETSFKLKSSTDGPTYGTTERIFRLLHLLTGSDCTQDDIFERLKDYYKVTDGDDPRVKAPSQRVGKMLRRDLQFL